MTSNLSAEDAKAILQFLSTAPENIGQWAEEQTELVSQALSSAAEEADQANESADFYADFDEADDDIIQSKLAKRKSSKPPKGNRIPLLGWVALGSAVVAGMSLSLWIGGAPPPGQSVTSHPTVATTTDDSALMDRKLELEFELTQDPTNVEMRIELADILANIGFSEDAILHLEEATALDPESIDAWYRLGYLYAPTNVAMAESAWNHVVEIAPDSAEAERALLQRLAAVRGRLSLCADQAAAAKWWLSMPMASVSAEGPMPKALSTRRTSPLMPGCRHQGRACPLRRARMTSNPLIVA